MKKIGILVEGREEQIALGHIINKLKFPDAQILKPIYANMQPKGPVGQIVKAVENKISIISKSDLILVLIDKEDSDVCVVSRAAELKSAFHNKGYKQVEVVIKNCQFENWLIADPKSIGQLKDFSLTENFKRKVENNKADHVRDPVGLLSGLKNNGKPFHKTIDGTEIAKKLNVENAACNSRSLRRFLRLLGHNLGYDHPPQSSKTYLKDPNL